MECSKKLSSFSQPTNYLYSDRSIHSIDTEHVPAKLSTKESPGFLNFSMISIIHCFDFFSGRTICRGFHSLACESM